MAAGLPSFGDGSRLGVEVGLRGRPHACASPNDTSYSGQWAPQKVQADLAWGVWVPKAQVVIAIGLSFLLVDLALYKVRTIPLTTLHKSAITDFPLMILRYVVSFPLLVAILLHYEPMMERDPLHLLGTALILGLSRGTFYSLFMLAGGLVLIARASWQNSQSKA